MKTYIPYSLILAAASCGLAFGAATAYTTPVGYETLSIKSGFNYLGIRLHQPVVAAGKLEAVSTTTVTDNDVDLGAILADNKMYILEVANANGVTQEFMGSAAGANGSHVITTPGDFSSQIAVGDSYKIRVAPTLASVFGPANQAGLAPGFFGPGDDIILLPNPSAAGGFDQYYYDGGQSSYVNSTTQLPVDGATVAFNYSDSVVISSLGTGATSLVVSGEVKTAKTGYALLAGGKFNYLSSIYPAGATLASAFNGSIASLDQGFFGPGDDIILLPNSAAPGGFDQYYYDQGYVSWVNSVTSLPVDATTINLPSGIVITNGNAAINLVNSPAGFYSSL